MKMAAAREDALNQRMAAIAKDREDRLKQFNALRDSKIAMMKMNSIAKHNTRLSDFKA